MDRFLNPELRWFAGQLRLVLPSHLLSIALVVLSSLMFLLDPLLLKWLIDDVLPVRDLHMLLLAGAGFLAIYLLRLVFSAAGAVVNVQIVQALVIRVRLTILEQMNRLSADFHEITPVGEKLYRVEQDVHQIAELGSNIVPYALQALSSSVLVVGAMFVLNTRRTSAGLPLGPGLFVVGEWLDRPVSEPAAVAHQ